jgi:alpha-L-fucosidase
MFTQLRLSYVGLCGFMFMLIYACTEPPPIVAIGPVPTPQQLAWQKMEYYAFIHFNMNTFTNKEWGYGDESPAQFNPTELDAHQWARIIKEAGMKGIIITAKHHDGFCLWPSAYTEHSVKNSPWRDGQGDLIRELAEACQAYGLKLGIYLSPWDRNHPDYGTPAYIDYFRNQLHELLTQYGPIFEVWFDGANGGDGYYGGAREERRVDKKSYYDWPTTHALVKELQPDAVIFSDAGPDIRWVGNEKGYAFENSWSTIFRDSVYAGMPDFDRFAKGQENGTHWIPTESDVSIRPGWYYHPDQDQQVKSLSHLVDIYYKSVGRNSALLLNIPVDTRGRIHENDEKQLMALADYLQKSFEINWVKDAKISASSSHPKHAPENLQQADPSAIWAASQTDTQPQLTLLFDQAVTANTLMIQEAIALGQRVKKFEVALLQEDQWQTIYTGETIGNKRLLRFDTQTLEGVRITFLAAKGPVVINELGLFNALELPTNE